MSEAVHDNSTFATTFSDTGKYMQLCLWNKRYPGVNSMRVISHDFTLSLFTFDNKLAEVPVLSLMLL